MPEGGVPDGGEPELDPDPDSWPLPMFGQLWVEPVPELELEPDEELPDEPELVFPLELDDGDVVLEPDAFDDELELEPEFPVEPVVPEVVAALATSAPPTTRPEVSAPAASTLRRRICISFPFVRLFPPFRAGDDTMRPAPWVQRTAPLGNGSDRPTIW